MYKEIDEVWYGKLQVWVAKLFVLMLRDHPIDCI